MKKNKAAKQRFPKGWNEKREAKLIEYYDIQTEYEELAEYEAGIALNRQSMMLVPTELMPEFRKLIARHQKAS